MLSAEVNAAIQTREYLSDKVGICVVTILNVVEEKVNLLQLHVQHLEDKSILQSSRKSFVVLILAKRFDYSVSVALVYIGGSRVVEPFL